MHLLRLFLTAWLALGVVSPFLLFWLFRICKRTAQRLNTLDKPVLNQEAFQQLLGAAYTLQEQNRVAVREPLSPQNDSSVPSYGDRRISRSDEFFWRVATGLAMVAVSALLLVASLDHITRLPRGREVVEQEVPLHRVLPQSGGVTTKTNIMESQATKTERPTVADTPPGSAIRSSSPKIRNPKRHSPYENEADMVAQDTVLRYGRSR